MAHTGNDNDAHFPNGPFVDAPLMRGTDGSDSFTNAAGATVQFEGLDGADTYEGSASALELIDFQAAPGRATVNLLAGFAVDGYGNFETLSDIDGIRGSMFDDIFVGTDGSNTIIGLDGADTIQALDGQDMIAGGAGNDSIDGGNGLDFAAIGATYESADVTIRGVEVSVSSSDGDDMLNNVERLLFEGVDLALDISAGDNAGDVYRLYQAAYDRAPDIEGLSFWIDQADDGLSLVQIANGFINSDEFESVYGADPTNEAYVDQLYENILDRDGEPAGFNFWVDALEDGTSRTEVLAAFSQSEENVDLVAPQIAGGIVYNDIA